MRKLVLWGHHLDEYREMFDLKDKDLQYHILEYGSGVSAFNVEIQTRNPNVVSMDPLFNLDKATLSQTSLQIFNERTQQIIADKEAFDFQRYGDLQALIKYRRQGVQQFFEDYQNGLVEKRYRFLEDDINLPLADFTFDLALSSHYFFAEANDSELEWHIKAIKELARVAKEVRIFPLIDRFGQPSPLLGPVLLALQQANLGAEIRDVAYHLQPAGHALLRVWAHQCALY